MRKTLLFLLLSIFCNAFATAQEIEDASQDRDTIYVNPQEVLVYDTDSRQPVQLDKAFIDELKQDEDFNYIDATPEDNAWTRFKAWLSNLWRSFLRSIFGVSEAIGFWAVVVRLLPYIGIAILIGLLVWIFMKIDSGTLMGERLKAPGILLSDDEELINNQDLKALIDQALSAKNYRLAIRYKYLLVLQMMSAKDLIDWQVQKTNHDYIFEIQDQILQGQFKKVTELYDIIWYGNFEVDETAFAKAETPFKNLQNTL